MSLLSSTSCITIALMLCSLSPAEEDSEPKEVINANLYGFAYYTFFQDKDWQKDEARIAVNGNISAEHFSIKGQVSTQTNYLRRLTLEYAAPINVDSFFTLRAGRMVRLDGFYNNVTDSPSTSGMSVLPLATYNRAMNTGTFTILDGISLCAMTRVGKSFLLETGVRYGSAFIDSEADLQKEAFGKVVSQNLLLDRQNNNYDFIAKLYSERNDVYLFSYNHYAINTYNGNILDPLSAYISNFAEEVQYDTIKIGAMRSIGKFTYSGEYHYGKTRTFSLAGAETSRKDAHNAYLKVAYDFTDNIELFTMYNYGMLESDISRGKNFTVGVLFNYGTYLFNVEWHKGISTKGSWARYENQDWKHDWNSFVASAIIRF